VARNEKKYSGLFYMKDLLNKIHNCKNQEILPLIPDKSIQCFIEDMPYNITACHWDKKQDLEEYWNLRLSKIKDNGCFVLFGSEPFSSYLRMSNIKMYKYDWYWNKSKPTGFINAKNAPLKKIENVIVFSKNNTANNNKNNMLYIPQNIKISGIKISSKYNKDDILGIRPSRKNNGYIQEFKNYPNNLLNFNSISNTIHPTQKPVVLFEYLIKTYSNENDLIFDGFSGSGTTAIACHNLKRNFICCEIDKGYYDKSVERLNNELDKNTIF
jgi:site-specific DNA-methyltransferase (adenine-specific)